MLNATGLEPVVFVLRVSAIGCGDASIDADRRLERTMATTRGTCATCRFSTGDDKSFLTGQMECHRYPPAGRGVDDFPNVSPDGWCGEFAAADD
jgi:hypothetical protein